MPTAQPDTARTLTGMPVVITVLSNDSGGGLAVVAYSQPTAGTLALNPDQSFSYAPAIGFEGVDAFNYTVRDAIGGSSVGEVTIVVSRANAPPIARNDSAEVQAGGSVVTAVLANDNDPDGDAFSIIAIDAPGQGTVQVEPDQRIRYTPQPGFSGIDSFAYTIGDGRGGIATANVTLTVIAPNAAPVARPDTAATLSGLAVTIDALANDNDPEGGPLNLAGMSLPAHGSLTLTPQQGFRYTPADGFVGEDGFSYTIRDSGGATATAEVTVAVEHRNAPPVATADNVASSGQPVTIDLLANDNDPDGDPLHLSALTLPIAGRIALNPDGKVTYTPPSGFSGSDSFTYQVSDGTAVAEGQVSVAVTLPSPPVYANGYRYRRRIVVPPQAAAAEIATDFVLLVRESGDWLKPVANGGRVEHPQGFDLRFELEDGTKLDHEIERYLSGNGSLMAWVRIPSFQLASQLRLFLYHGKAALAATEANPAGAWRGYLAVLDARTGNDRSAHGRALAPTNVAAGELIGDAGLYAGNAVASRTDASFLNGLSALTVQALVAGDAAMVGSDHGVLAQGVMNGTDAAAGVVLQYRAQSSDGSPNVVQFKVACADGAAFVFSGANTQRAGTQLLHGVWQQGQIPALYIDGGAAEPSASSVARAGVTAMPAGGFYLGAGAHDPATGGWRGLIDEVRIAATAFSAARIAGEAANLATPQALYGLGDDDQAGEADKAPVAVPVRAATTAGMHVDIDVAAAAYDPDGPGLPEIVAVGAPGHGVVTVAGGRIRYTPVAGYVGADSFTYTLDNAGKRSASYVFVSVAAAPVAELPSPLRTISIGNAAQLTKALDGDITGLATVPSNAHGPLVPGDHLVLADGTYAGSYALARAGTADAPIVIRAANVLQARFTGSFALNGADGWLWGGEFDGASVGVQMIGARARVMRCSFHGIRSGTGNSGKIAVAPKSSDQKIMYSLFYDLDSRGISCDNAAPRALRPHIYRCYFRDSVPVDAPAREGIQFGQTQAPNGTPTLYVMSGLLEKCLFERYNIGGAIDDENETVSVKSTGNRIVGCTFLDTNLCNLRFGLNNRVEACWYEGSNENMGIGVRGDDHVLIGNRLRGTKAAIWVFTGNQTQDVPDPDNAGSWNNDGDDHPNARRAKLIGNDSAAATIIGKGEGSAAPLNALDTVVEAHVGPVTWSNWTGRTISGTASEPVPVAVKLAAADVGPYAPWIAP